MMEKGKILLVGHGRKDRYLSFVPDYYNCTFLDRLPYECPDIVADFNTADLPPSHYDAIILVCCDSMVMKSGKCYNDTFACNATSNFLSDQFIVLCYKILKQGGLLYCGDPRSTDTKDYFRYFWEMPNIVESNFRRIMSSYFEYTGKQLIWQLRHYFPTLIFRKLKLWI